MRRLTEFTLVSIKFNQKILILGFIGLAATSALLPKKASAFWPFSNANAATSAAVPVSSTPTLQAATNLDPNPNKNAVGVHMSGNAMLAYGGPSGTTADVASSTAPGNISVYVVRQGDTLSEIADMFGVSINTIIWANNLGSAKNVHPGDTLVILPVSGVERTVVKGDTLKSLAKKYSADAGEIAEYNGLDPADSLVIGSKIIIPGGEISAPTVIHSSGSRRVISEPYLGGSGSAQNDYYSNPIPGAILTQSIHGWNAIDLGAARGTPIHAAADGTAIIARNNGGWNGGYGNYVVITHGNGTQTLYAHMSHTIVSSGQTVSAGQIIGYVGMTGLTTGPHLHIEFRGAANPFRDCSVGSVCEPE